MSIRELEREYEAKKATVQKLSAELAAAVRAKNAVAEQLREARGQSEPAKQAS